MRAIPLALQTMREHSRTDAPHLEEAGDNELQVFVAMWSHTEQEPQGWYCASNAEYGDPSGVAYQLCRVSSIINPPVALPFRTAQDAAALIEAQRRWQWPDGMRYVGGFGELITVSAKGIDRRRVVQWPDRLGERIAA